MSTQVTIEVRQPQFNVPTEEAGEPLYAGLFVRATIVRPEGTRCGPYWLELPADASDDTVKAAIAALFE